MRAIEARGTRGAIGAEAPSDRTWKRLMPVESCSGPDASGQGVQTDEKLLETLDEI